MSTDWSAIAKAVDDAARETDDRLAQRIAGLTRLTDAEVKSLFPKKGDVEKLAELMEIVRDSTTQTQKVNRLAENVDRLGGVVIALLGKLV